MPTTGPAAAPPDDDADDDDRPSRSRRAVDDDDDDRPSRSRRAVADEDRPSRSRRAVNPEAGSKKVAAGLFALLLGGFGVHKFYLGMSGPGSIMLAMTLGGWAGCISGFFCLVTLPIGLAAFASGVIALIEGIIYLTKTDAEFDRIYIRGQKQWF